MSLLETRAEFIRLHTKITDLETELADANKACTFYRRQLDITRRGIIDIFNLSGAKTEVADSESIIQAWARYIEAIKGKLKNAT